MEVAFDVLIPSFDHFNESFVATRPSVEAARTSVTRPPPQHTVSQAYLHGLLDDDLFDDLDEEQGKPAAAMPDLEDGELPSMVFHRDFELFIPIPDAITAPSAATSSHQIKVDAGAAEPMMVALGDLRVQLLRQLPLLREFQSTLTLLDWSVTISGASTASAALEDDDQHSRERERVSMLSEVYPFSLCCFIIIISSTRNICSCSLFVHTNEI
jgi:hypothetical protein